MIGATAFLFGDALYSLGKYEAAFPWLERAANVGHAGAAHMVAVMYSHGLGVEVDEKKAYEKFMTAAALQMTKRPYRVFEGQTYFALGYCCESGRGTEKDYRRALNWYKEAREHKVTKADAKFLELLALTTATETQKMQKTTSVLSRAQALERLDVKEGASKEVMRAAYMRLIKQMHPDKGGSNFFTKQLNEVRDVLNL